MYYSSRRRSPGGKPAAVLLLLSLSALRVAAIELTAVLDVREEMVKRAHDNMVAEYAKIGSDYENLMTVCSDVRENTFPDMCMPPGEGYVASSRVYNEQTKAVETVQYDDTRPTNGKNAPTGLKMSEKFGVDAGKAMGYKFQPKTPQTDAVYAEVCATRGVGKIFTENTQGESSFGDLATTTSWQYFGGQVTGMFAQYPVTVKTMCWCDGYDPRYRPWYASAVTGPKDMVLVLDVSGSMGDANRLAIMKEAALAQLDTMTFLDYVQVVKYSTSADSMGSELLQGTNKNKRKMAEYIKALVSGGSTNGEAGIKKAFNIFKASTTAAVTSGCTRIISFLTDGSMNTKEWVSDGTLTALQNFLGDNNDAHIFTYALGSGARTEELKIMSCNHRGWLSKVPDNKPEELKRAMVGYFEYFANHIPANINATARWSDFYIDSSGQGIMTTVSLPVFTTSGTFPFRTFRGVVGIDVLSSDFGNNLDDSGKAVQLKLRSQQCMVFNHSIDNPSASVKNQCEIKMVESTGTFVPTGATLNEVSDDYCNSYFPWWAILLTIFIPLGCFAGVCVYLKKKAAQKKVVHPTQQMVVHHHVQQQMNFPHQQPQMGYVPGQPQPMMYPEQPAAMMMHQQQPAAMMMNQQPGIQTMQPMAMPMAGGVQPHAYPVVQQPGGGVPVVHIQQQPQQGGFPMQQSGFPMQQSGLQQPR